MYCPDCGMESTEGLNYCKRCGTSLSTQQFPAPQNHLSKTTVTLFLILLISALIGFLTLMMTASDLVNKPGPGHDTIPMMAIMLVFGTGSLLGLVSLLSWALLKLSGVNLKDSKKPSPRLKGPMEAKLINPPPPVYKSVIEGTTRSLEEAQVKDSTPGKDYK